MVLVVQNGEFERFEGFFVRVVYCQYRKLPLIIPGFIELRKGLGGLKNGGLSGRAYKRHKKM